MTASISPSVRAGDRERERAADQLGSALAQGYLQLGEYETRLQAAFAAKTTAELRGLVADLPLAHLAGYLAMVVIVLTVWLAVGLTAGAWYFWPVWPILGAGIGVLGHAPVRDRGSGCARADASC
jgi:hypothetical protein